MRQELKNMLIVKAKEAATKFSDPNRNYNGTRDIFQVEDVLVQSEDTAFVIFLKQSGLKALAVFYYNRGFDDFVYFFPTDSHILGMQNLQSVKRLVEQYNFENTKMEE